MNTLQYQYESNSKGCVYYNLCIIIEHLVAHDVSTPK